MYLSAIFLRIVAITLLLTNSAFSQDSVITESEHPVYKDGKLTIPRVDTDLQAGNFQDATFFFDRATNAWQLLDYRETLLIPGQSPYLDTVEAIVTDSIPVQVFLKISGNLPTPCSRFGQINQRLKINKFEVTMHVASSLLSTSCIQVLEPFVKIIPLEVFGLSAGTYEYSVNGEYSGTFSLTTNNTFPIN